MELNEYQKEAYKNAQYGYGDKVIYPTLGLCGEAGELANKVKKVLRDNNGKMSPDRKKAILAELGDNLWYIGAIATDLDATLEDVALSNLAKLKDRRERDMIKGDGDNR